MGDRSNPVPGALRVLGALLGESLEASLLRQAIRPPTLLRRAEDRLRMLAMVREYAPDVIVFSVQDAARLSTTPLIEQCVRERSDVRIVLLCAAPPPRSQAIIAAARLGARVLVAPTVDEITLVLARIARLSALELTLDCDALAVVQPPRLRELLCAAAKTVAGDGRVVTLAQQLRVSTRTLSRYSHQATLAPPRTLLAAARLLWACALMESARHDMRAVARMTGFEGPQALMVASRRYLHSRDSAVADTPLPRYRDALRHIVGALGGYLVT